MTRIAPLLLALISSGVIAQDYEPPRTASGKPDLQGFWTNASITTMQRSSSLADVGLVIPADQLSEYTANNHQNVRAATDDNQVQGELPNGSDLAQGRGYNAFWVDPGSRFGMVNGEARTSWITYPSWLSGPDRQDHRSREHPEPQRRPHGRRFHPHSHAPPRRCAQTAQHRL